jgi:hypothetical protein
MPKSIIADLQFKKESVAPFGTFYIFIMELEDGTKGDYFSKTKDTDKFIGQEIEYTYEPNANPQYLGKIKEVSKSKPNIFTKTTKNETPDNARASLMAATHIAKNKEEVLVFAETYFNWLQIKSNS